MFGNADAKRKFCWLLIRFFKSLNYFCMSNLSSQIRIAKEKRGKDVESFTSISNLLGTSEWSEDIHAPQFESLKRSIKDGDALLERLNDSQLLMRGSGVPASIDLDDDDSTEHRSAGATVAVIDSSNLGDKWDKVRSKFSLLRAVRCVSDRGLDGLEREMHQEAQIEGRSMGTSFEGNLQIPSALMSRVGASPDMFQGTQKRDVLAQTASAGGNTIATVLGPMIEFLDPRLVVREMGATYFPGQTSNLSFPTNTANGEAEWAGEVTTSQEIDPVFGLLELKPKRLTAHTDVSRMNLVQTSLSMENLVRRRLNRAVMTKLERTCFNGSGTGNVPLGILNVSGVNDVDLGANGGLLDWKKTVLFETLCSIENADMGSLGYVFTSGVSGDLKTVKRDIAGNGFIWEGNNFQASVNGYKAMSTNLLPSNLTKGTGTNLHAAIFGNFEDLYIAQFGGIDILVNPYTKGKEGLVEMIVYTLFDLGVAHNKSFTICNEIAIQ